jgi:hypothetical protein
MTSQNEEAEELMRRIEKEEERVAYEDTTKRVYHLCIVNLVIGTLYCAKGNHEFGISRIMKSLEPYNRKVTLVCVILRPSDTLRSWGQIRGIMPRDALFLCSRYWQST